MSDREAGVYIRRIGTAVPEQSLSLEGAVQLLREGCINRRSQKLLERIIRLTGVERRYLAALDFQNGDQSLYRPTAQQPLGPGMGARTEMFDRAAGPLVARALSSFPREGLERVAVLVTASCTHASSPGLERPVLEHTPLPAGVDRWNLGFMGCSAGLAAVRLIHQLQPPRDALVVACELSSLHFQYTDKIDQMTANLLFADGAAALLLSAQPARVRVRACRCVSLPRFADQMVWRADDHGLALELSPDLPDTLAAGLPEAIGCLLDHHDWRFRDVDHWLVHPGGPQILDAVERCLRLPDGALHLSREVLRTHGNMSSPSIFFILASLLDAGQAGRVAAIAFGPGLTIEMALLEVDRG